MARGLIHLHRETHRWIDGPNAALLKLSHDCGADLVDLVTRSMELKVCDRTRHPTHRLPRHAENEAQQRLGPGIVSNNLVALRVESGARDLDQTGIIRTAIQSETAQPRTVQYVLGRLLVFDSL